MHFNLRCIVTKPKSDDRFEQILSNNPSPTSFQRLLTRVNVQTCSELIEGPEPTRVRAAGRNPALPLALRR
jgi:hypothetical protein